MEELVSRVAGAAGIAPDVAQKAIGIILGFLNKEAPSEVGGLLDQLPGAHDAIATAAEEPSSGGGIMGSLMGMMGGGGGIMGLASQLTGAGLGMGEMQSVGKELFSFVREKAGDEAVGKIAGAVPGLSQFI